MMHKVFYISLLAASAVKLHYNGLG